MSSSMRRSGREDIDADPWWGDGAAQPATTTAKARPRTPRTGRRTGIGWILLGIVVAPLDLLRRLVRRSPRVRRLLVRVAVLGVILVILACSVGVILINNVVIGRTAELGELDDRRRELRRDNAVLGARAARLEAAEVVYRRAKELGMVRTGEVPEFVYLYDASRTLTNRQRLRVAQRARPARDRAPSAPVAAAETKAKGTP